MGSASICDRRVKAKGAGAIGTVVISLGGVLLCSGKVVAGN